MWFDRIEAFEFTGLQTGCMSIAESPTKKIAIDQLISESVKFDGLTKIASCSLKNGGILFSVEHYIIGNWRLLARI